MSALRVVPIRPAGRLRLTTGDQVDIELEITQGAARDPISAQHVRATIVGSFRQVALTGAPIALTQLVDLTRWRLVIPRERTRQLVANGMPLPTIRDDIALLELQVGDVANGDATEETEHLEVDISVGTII